MQIKAQTASLLRRLERFTKTDMVYLASGGFWLSLEQIILGLLAFGVSVAFAHYVSAETYGTYRFLLSLFWTLAAFSLTGIPTAVNRAVAKGEEGAYRQAIPLSFLGALPMSLVAGTIALYYFLANNYVLGWGAVAMCVIAPFFQASYLFGSVLEGRRDFKKTAIFGVILNLVPALSLLAVMQFAKSPFSFFLTYLLSNTIMASLLTALIFRFDRPNNTKSTEVKNLGWHMSVLNIIGTIAGQLDQLLIYHFIGAPELAMYSFATAIPDQLKSMATNIGNLAFPKLVVRNIRDIQSSMVRRMAMLTLVFALGTVFYVWFAPSFFHVFFPAYERSIFYSQLYAMSLITISAIIPTTVLQAHAAKRELYIFNVSTAVVQIISSFAGVFLYGLIGLILARAFSRFFNLFMSTILVKRYEKRMRK